MEFICQVALDPGMFDTPLGAMAYVFMTGDDEEGHTDFTWAPGGGENAVIIQAPEGPTSSPESSGIVVQVTKAGPCVAKWDGSEWVPCEFATVLTLGIDPGFVGDDELWRSWDQDAREAHFNALDGNKIGGTPGFQQGEEFPEGGPWRQLLQLDSTTVPFYVHFGDAGIGHAFVSQDGRVGGFLWQCA